MFGLGSILAWALIRNVVPRNNALTTGLGVASGYAIVRISYDYLNHVDSLAVEKKA